MVDRAVPKALRSPAIDLVGFTEFSLVGWLTGSVRSEFYLAGVEPGTVSFTSRRVEGGLRL